MISTAFACCYQKKTFLLNQSLKVGLLIIQSHHSHVNCFMKDAKQTVQRFF
ncbi:MAG: hypothetical protein ACJAS1_006825 [Oleiphilaceae bacterium]|jgi:hypothetical protein